MRVNRSFSSQLRNLQLTVDQTSLGLFKTCPRKYFYRMVLGVVPRRQNVDLFFGALVHEGCEKYEWAKAEGQDHQAALRAAIRYVLKATWDYETGRPWYSGDPDKNRHTLVRSLVWYLDSFGEKDTMETIILKNGRPAIELTFNFNPHDPETGDPLLAMTGEEIVFSGHLDRMVMFQGKKFISDRKTTKYRLDQRYFAQYNPHNQFSMYTLAGQWLFGEDITGVVCDAMQVVKSHTEFERQNILRDAEQIREWYADTRYWLTLMGHSAEANRYPQNDMACNMYKGCEYRDLCKRSPAAREVWRETDYRTEVWDPSVARGD